MVWHFFPAGPLGQARVPGCARHCCYQPQNLLTRVHQGPPPAQLCKAPSSNMEWMLATPVQGIFTSGH